jgi:cell division protein FtsB
VNPQQRLTRLARTAVGGRASTAARTPFVLLVVVLLGSGLLALLLLNASLNQGSFQVSRLEQKTGVLTEKEQALEQKIASRSDPEALRKRARELGMVPGGPPAFVAPDGTVHGSPAPATALPEPSPEEPAEEPAEDPAHASAEEQEEGRAEGTADHPTEPGESRAPQPRVQPEESAQPE